jgi:LacI family transcriptional regulator
VSGTSKKRTKKSLQDSGAVSLKTLAKYLKLSPTTISLVLNGSAESIPQETKDRVFAAATKFNYRPNFFARSLRNKKTSTIGILIRDMGDAYGSVLITGIEGVLREEQYFYLLVNHHHQAELLDRYINLLLDRGVEGFIAIDTDLRQPLPAPTVAISGHRALPGVTNIVVDQKRAAEEGLKHLVALGHQRIVFMRGQPFSSDAAERWECYLSAARDLGIRVDPELFVQLESEDMSPQAGYPVMSRLLEKTRNFTAVFAYNDLSAIGAIRALNDVGLRVPEDVSVVGFDDIPTAAFYSPSLTTVRQPLRDMGQIAAATLLGRLNQSSEAPATIAVEPELIVRESSGPAPTMKPSPRNGETVASAR